jgi:hypothetical protein
MNLQSNPWSFAPGDVVVATPTASPNGLLLQTNGTINVVTTAPHAFVVGNIITLVDPTNDLYEGCYQVVIVPDTTHMTLTPVATFKVPAGTGNSGGGTIALVQWPHQIRIEDISWQQIAAQGNILNVVDCNGNPIWVATGAGAGVQNRGKVYWVSGLALVQMDAGILLVTVN